MCYCSNQWPRDGNKNTFTNENNRLKINYWKPVGTYILKRKEMKCFIKKMKTIKERLITNNDEVIQYNTK